jgi:hypothetical protein
LFACVGLGFFIFSTRIDHTAALSRSYQEAEASLASTSASLSSTQQSTALPRKTMAAPALKSAAIRCAPVPLLAFLWRPALSLATALAPDERPTRQWRPADLGEPALMRGRAPPPTPLAHPSPQTCPPLYQARPGVQPARVQAHVVADVTLPLQLCGLL